MGHNIVTWSHRVQYYFMELRIKNTYEFSIPEFSFLRFLIFKTRIHYWIDILITNTLQKLNAKFRLSWWRDSSTDSVSSLKVAWTYDESFHLHGKRKEKESRLQKMKKFVDYYVHMVRLFPSLPWVLLGDNHFH